MPQEIKAHPMRKAPLIWSHVIEQLMKFGSPALQMHLQQSEVCLLTARLMIPAVSINLP